MPLPTGIASLVVLEPLLPPRHPPPPRPPPRSLLMLHAVELVDSLALVPHLAIVAPLADTAVRQRRIAARAAKPDLEHVDLTLLLSLLSHLPRLLPLLLPLLQRSRRSPLMARVVVPTATPAKGPPSEIAVALQDGAVRQMRTAERAATPPLAHVPAPPLYPLLPQPSLR